MLDMKKLLEKNKDFCFVYIKDFQSILDRYFHFLNGKKHLVVYEDFFMFSIQDN